MLYGVLYGGVACGMAGETQQDSVAYGWVRVDCIAFDVLHGRSWWVVQGIVCKGGTEGQGVLWREVWQG